MNKVKRAFYFLLCLPFILSSCTEESKNLGRLKSDCNQHYEVEILLQRGIDWNQGLSYSIIKDDSISITSSWFTVTNNQSERLKNFTIDCVDGIIFVTWKAENYILIMFDTKKEIAYPDDGVDLANSQVDSMFTAIKKVHPELILE